MSVIDMTGAKGGKKRPGKSMMKNTPEDEAVTQKALENSGARLLEIIEGVEELMDRRAAISEDMKQRFAVAKSEGFSVAAIKSVIKRRNASPESLAALAELETVAEVYWSSLEAAG